MTPSTSTRQISVWAPVSLALARVKSLLFEPFDLSRWLAIGFCAWLAFLAEAGGGGSFPVGGNGKNRASPAEVVKQSLDSARDYASRNLFWIIPVAAVVILVVLAVWLTLLWLSSRGRFMFLDNVVTGRAEVVAPWHHFSAPANSLFQFRILLVGVGALILLPFAVAATWASVRMLMDEAISAPAIVVVAASTLLLLILGLGLWLVGKITNDFVVPLMWRDGLLWRPAWSRIANLLRAHLGDLILYLLFQIVIAIAIGLMLVGLMLVTCCVASCVLAIPYIGTVVLLPLFVFGRAYSAYYLGQFGPAFDVFQPRAETSNVIPPNDPMPPLGQGPWPPSSVP